MIQRDMFYDGGIGGERSPIDPTNVDTSVYNADVDDRMPVWLKLFIVAAVIIAIGLFEIMK